MSEQQNQRKSSLDESLQREIEEALGGKSLEELLDEAVPVRKQGEGQEALGEVAAGQVRNGRVVAIDRDSVMIDLGGKDQGIVNLDQFKEAPAVGSRLDLQVVRYDRGEDLWILSREGAVEHATWDSLAVGQIVEAFVEASNKGGLEVKFGGIKAFMPVSQISIYRVETPAEFVGQKIRCQIVEVNKREERIIASGRAVMEIEAEAKREALLAELKEGDVRKGVVRQIMPFGAFVDLGGVDGLVHVSQLSHVRVEKPEEVVKTGQTVEVKVLKIDREANRISLSMKETMPDPWESAENKYPAGLTTAGLVTRLADFGAFCQLEPGVEGLIPIGEISWTQRLRHPSDVLKTGDNVQVKVLSVDLARKRISLSIKQAQANPWNGAALRYPAQGEVTGRVSRLAEFGAFVELEPGVDGLVHISEMSDQRVNRVEDVVQVGQAVKVRVLEVNEEARRISLTMKGMIVVEEPAPAAEGTAAAQPAAQPKKRKKALRGGLE